MNFKLKIFLVITLLFTSFFSVSAQVKDADMSVSVSPEIPGPNQETLVTISSFTTNLDKAQISWILNGDLVLSGVGRKSLSFKTGSAGNPTTIDINVNIVGLPTISKRVIIQPGEVDLLWEAIDSYVPPFYRGKALPVSESQIKVVAIPNIKTPDGTRLTEKDFAYSWEKNFDADLESSGYNKNSFTFKNSYLEDTENVSVMISSILGNYTAGGEVSINLFNPKISFYERDPALGIKYTRSLLNGFDIGERSVLITAVPYFFSLDNLKYDWTINGQKVETTGRANELAVKSDKKGGASDIGLMVENTSKLFQKTNGVFEVTY